MNTFLEALESKQDESIIEGLFNVLKSLEDDHSQIKSSLSPVLNMAKTTNNTVKSLIIKILSFVLKLEFKSEDVSCSELLICINTLLTYLESEQNPLILNQAILSCSTTYCNIFRFLAEHPPIDSTLWLKLKEVERLVAEKLFYSKNSGVKICSIKFMSTLIILHFDSGAQIRTDNSFGIENVLDSHPFIDKLESVKKSRQHLSKLLSLVQPGTIANTATITAALNCLFQITKILPHTNTYIIPIILILSKNPPISLSNFQLKSLERTLKVILLHFLRSPNNANYADDITDILLLIGVNSREISFARKLANLAPLKKNYIPLSNTKRVKRLAVENEEAENKIFSEHILNNIDIHQLPVGIVVEIIVRTAEATSEVKWKEAVEKYKDIILNGPISSKAKRLKLAQSRDPRRAINQDVKSVKADAAVIKAPSVNKAVVEAIASEADENEEVLDEDEIDGNNIDDRMEEEVDGSTNYEKIYQSFKRILEFENINLEKFENSITNSSNSTTSNANANKLFDNKISKTKSMFAMKEGWGLIISRLASQDFIKNLMNDDVLVEKSTVDLQKILLNFILQDFKARHELAVLWLHEEWLVSRKKFAELNLPAEEEENFMKSSSYFLLFHDILSKLHQKVDHIADYDDEYGVEKVAWVLEPKDRTFTKFLIDAPELNSDSLKFVKDCCEDEARMPLGISTLRDLVHLRPAIRENAIQILLELCTHRVRTTRNTAIVTVKRWFQVESLNLTGIIEDFSKKCIMSLTAPSVEILSTTLNEVDKMEEPGEIWKEEDVVRCLELFLSLCSKKFELLIEVFFLYPKVHPSAQAGIRNCITPLVKSMYGHQNPAAKKTLLDVISNFPRGSELLVLKLIILLTEKGKPSQELVNVVKDVIQRFKLDIRFLLPILTGLDKPEILSILPKLFRLLDGTEKEQKVVKEALIKLCGSESGETPSILPAEVLIAAHNMEEAIGVKTVMEATQICFSLPNLFDEEVLAFTMQKLADQQKLPILLMRTIMLSVKAFKGLTANVNTILSKLVGRKVWTNKNLWAGFIRCCDATSPGSFHVFVTLPKEQIEDALKQVPKLKPGLRNYLENLSAAQKNSGTIQNIFSLL
ncbi:hypothetical protein HDU92_002477 [Lobulomyces angularis]|nr:hypothetical protein HDU92_002477 [Lobulomyces angularis]